MFKYYMFVKQLFTAGEIAQDFMQKVYFLKFIFYITHHVCKLLYYMYMQIIEFGQICLKQIFRV